MHDSVRDWVKYNIGHVGPDTRILEVGSADVNGGVAGLFSPRQYTGIDHQPGVGVDIVLSSHNLTGLFDPDSFDLVLCLEMLEHDPNPFLTLQQIAEVLAPDGAAIITARANGFPLHNEPDLWRFMEDGMHALIEQAGLIVGDLQPDIQVDGWFAVAVKPGVIHG